MTKDKKRPKYIEDIIRDANAQFRRKYTKDEDDSLFVWLCAYLLGKDMYQGFDYYRYTRTAGKNPIALAGSYKKDEFDFLQIL